MDTQTINIDPRVGLVEEQALSDHFRSRALFLGQRLLESEAKITELAAQVAEMSATIEAQATDLAALRPAAAAIEESN
ncbi:hypothetical protein ACIQUG_27495 [Ensifer sp. NPDC090286]|uniref:hypothetical protein n=1 Tax=Ensifer sp. NPDC090286 TaxID=3363991 RepID=UPI003839E92C